MVVVVLLIVRNDGTVRVWDLDTGDCRHILEGHTSRVNSVAMTANGLFALSNSQDGTIRVWELATGQCLHVLKGRATGVARLGGVAYRSAVPSIAVTTDERFALTIDDRIVRVWDLVTGDCLRTLEGHTHWVETVAVTADERFALTGGYDGAVRVWRLPNVPSDVCSFELCRPRAHAELVQHEMRLEKLLSAAELPVEESRFAEALALLRKAREIPGHERDPRVLDAWRRLSLFSVRTGIRGIWQSKVLENHTSTVVSVAVTADGRFALSGDGPTVRIWDLATGSCLHTLQGHPVGMGYSKVVGSVAVTADRRSPLTGQTEGTVRVWELATGRCLHTLQDHTGSVTSVAVTVDGALALSGGGDGTVRVWELSTGRCLRTLEAHIGWVQAVAVSADGHLALSSGDDGTVRVWEIDRELEATEPADWDERAAPYLEVFLARHTSPSRNSPSWTDADVDHLLRQLRYAAYGWLRPPGVKTELERRTRDWKPEPPNPSE